MTKPFVATASGICVVLLALLFAQIARPQGAQANITWSEGSVTLVVPSGGTAVKNLTWLSTQSLQNVTIAAVPNIGSFVNIQPSSAQNIPGNQPQRIRLQVTIASNVPLGSYAGTIHVRTGSNTLPATLKVTLMVVPSYPPATTSVGPAGIDVTLSNGIHFNVPSGGVSGQVSFQLASVPENQLPSSVPQLASIYAGIKISAIPLTAGSGPTANWAMTIKLPLTVAAPAGTPLVVLRPNLTGNNWEPTGDVAVVGADGLTATFTTRNTTMLLLVNAQDRGLENAP